MTVAERIIGLSPHCAALNLKFRSTLYVVQQRMRHAFDQFRRYIARFLLEKTDCGLTGCPEHNTDLLETNAIQSFLQLFNLMSAPVADQPVTKRIKPGSTFGKLAWDEQAKLPPPILTPRRCSKCVHELIEDQCARTPDAPAVVCGERALTYGELNDRATAVAQRLRELGVRPEARVGICMSRSPEMIIGLIAILKAGGAYVPIDPAYPQERISFMLRNAQIACLVTQPEILRALPPHDTEIVMIDDPGPAPDAITQLSRPFASPANLAYVMYTSGSAGEPKGVMVCHHNVVSFFEAMDVIIGLEPGVWLAVTSISFDSSVLELFWTLARGFKVILCEGAQAAADAIERHAPTHLQCRPSQAEMLADDPRAFTGLRKLKTFLLGGEALPVQLAHRLHDCGQLFNMYGLTETTVWSMVHPVNGDETLIPIGQPLANAEIHILDSEQNPVPVGGTGELYIGGDGVVRGYLNRPDLTKERFLDDPFRSQAGARLYRTGDLARWLPDGNVECLGPADLKHCKHDE